MYPDVCLMCTSFSYPNFKCFYTVVGICEGAITFGILYCFKLAADALFGGNGDQQEHSEQSNTILNPLLYTGRGARQSCRGRLDWEKA